MRNVLIAVVSAACLAATAWTVSAVGQSVTDQPAADPSLADQPVGQSSVAPSPVGRLDEPAPLTVRPTPLTPKALVDKSIQDVQQGKIGSAVKDDVEALRRGPLLIHGNYCGIGNRPGTQPTDRLDEACMHHDACTPTGGMPNCQCDARLRVEAAAIAADPATPPGIKAMAAATAASMAVLVCN